MDITRMITNRKSKTERITRSSSGIPKGFTLVELLVVITLMVSLSGMLTYALVSATNDAKIKRTQADVVVIGQLLQSRMNEVALSRVSLVYATTNQTGTPGGLGTGNIASPAAFAAAERSRLLLSARRDLMRMVLPECRADLLYPPASIQFRALVRTRNGSGFQANLAQLKPPAQWNRMRTLAGLPSSATLDGASTGSPCSDPSIDGIAAAYNNGSFRTPFFQFEDGDLLSDDTNDPDDRFWSRENESAECLYLILATTELFGEKAIDKIPASSIADTDGDGFLEVLDAWGTPYVFQRNPAGLNSPAIRNFNVNFDPNSDSIEEQYPSDPDPLDLLLSDWRYESSNFPNGTAPPQAAYNPYYLPPVVISAGLDRQFGIRQTYWEDEDERVLGVPEYYSSSAVTITTDTPTPRASGMVYRYPDPFFDASRTPFDIEFSITDIQTARSGSGLGGTTNREFSADNISSLSGDF